MGTLGKPKYYRSRPPLSQKIQTPHSALFCSFSCSVVCTQRGGTARSEAQDGRRPRRRLRRIHEEQSIWHREGEEGEEVQEAKTRRREEITQGTQGQHRRRRSVSPISPAYIISMHWQCVVNIFNYFSIFCELSIRADINFLSSNYSNLISDLA